LLSSADKGTLSFSTLIKVFLFLIAVSAVIGVYYFDLVRYLTLANIQSYKLTLGLWAPVIFVGAFMIGELLQIPSVLWIFFAAIIWPWWFAFPLALLAALLAAAVAFLVARFFLGHGFHKKLPASFQKLNRELERKPIPAVILLRLTTFLHPAIHWVLAASSIRILPFFIGTLIGITPLTLAIVLLGEVFLSWWDQFGWVIAAVVIGAIVILVMVRRGNQKPRED
jgi:uncharacterized membrane protein YdjX (TVP38/TMEM64 family)